MIYLNDGLVYNYSAIVLLVGLLYSSRRFGCYMYKHLPLVPNP